MVVTECDSIVLFHFLDALEAWASRNEVSSSQHVLDCVNMHRKFVGGHLTQPQKDDGEALLHAAMPYGDLQMLQSSEQP